MAEEVRDPVFSECPHSCQIRNLRAQRSFPAQPLCASHRFEDLSPGTHSKPGTQPTDMRMLPPGTGSAGFLQHPGVFQVLAREGLEVGSGSCPGGAQVGGFSEMQLWIPNW